MTHSEVQVALLEIALDLRRLDRRLADLHVALDGPRGPQSLDAPEVEADTDRPLNLAAAIQAQIVYTRETDLESAIQDLCLASQLGDRLERWADFQPRSAEDQIVDGGSLEDTASEPGDGCGADRLYHEPSHSSESPGSGASSIDDKGLARAEPARAEPARAEPA